MSAINDIDVLILTHNEKENIGRTLGALTSFPEVVVLDSGSTDGTLEIASGFPNVRVVTRTFDNHAAQWNFGLEQCGLSRRWVLALDADYVVSQDFVDGVRALEPSADVVGYRIGFRYCVFGKPLRGTLYPPVVALYRRAAARYVQEGHTQRVVMYGQIADLPERIDHDDRKPWARWVASQQRYARLEAEYLRSQPQDRLRRVDRLRLAAWPLPLLVPVYTLIIKRCILDGWPGWFYALQRTLAEGMIALELLDARLRSRNVR